MVMAFEALIENLRLEMSSVICCQLSELVVIDFGGLLVDLNTVW
jgi:hypothetical protein